MAEKNLIVDSSSFPSNLKKETWYLACPTGYLPEPRVGHTATYLPKERKVVFIGGANPSLLHKDTWTLDLAQLQCDRLAIKGDFEHRYEHCTFVPENISGRGEDQKTTIWVFGGANMEGNRNDLWELDLNFLKWNNLTQLGNVPSHRTIHTNTSAIDNKLLVFSGGSLGNAAKSDTSVYELDPRSKSWSLKATKGEPPQPRNGHVLVAVNDKLHVHGGLSGVTFFDDMYVLDNNGMWTLADASEAKPAARASHGAVSHGSYIYLFGGLGITGVLGDFWRISTDSYIWEEIAVNSLTLCPRLDFAMTVVDLPGKFSRARVEEICDSDPDDVDVNSIEDYLNKGVGGNKKTNPVYCKGDSKNNLWYPYIVVHGGMDGSGSLFDDFHLYGLDPKNDLSRFVELQKSIKEILVIS